MAELVGTHSYQLDLKGRISLPARFREAFKEGAFVTLGLDGCLFVFPRAEWERRASELQAVPLSDAHGRASSRFFFGPAEPVVVDNQGRLLVPQRLRAQVGIGREVVVLGVWDRMEIWDRAAWDRYEESFGGAYQAGALHPAVQGRAGP